MSDLPRRRQPAGIGIQICFEHHAPDTWPWFADRAAELGVSFVRLGEFVWDILETEEGRFHFDELDGFIELLRNRNIDTVLATPTASPPDWLCNQHPEIVPTLVDGKCFGNAVRRHTCPTSPRFRESSERIVRAMARRYHDWPSITGWQIDNEIGFPFCYCGLCHSAFQEWLVLRFRTIEEFNFHAGQFFLGRSSRSFEEIPLPQANSNPCLHHLYGLFMDHQIRECWGLQQQWLREEGVETAITSNAMLTWYGYDHEKFYEPLDLVTGDVYPAGGPYQDDSYSGLAFYSAYLRGIKHGHNFGMMELRCGPVKEGGAFPEPGAMKRWTYALMAGGADFLHFFRLDTSPSGLERGGFGVIPNTRALLPAFKELQQLGAEIKKLNYFLAETCVPVAPVGVLYSHASHLALQHKACLKEFEGNSGNGYPQHLARHFRALVSSNITADIVYPGEDFEKYKVLIVTGHAVMGQETSTKLAAFVEAGGVLIVWPWSGIYDENAKLQESASFAGLAGVCGASRLVTENFPTGNVMVEFSAQSPFELSSFSCSVADTLKVSPSAEILAIFRGHPGGENLAALTSHRYGKGTAYLSGMFCDESATVSLYIALLKRHGIEPEISTLPDVQHTKRVSEKREMHFFFNSSPAEVTMALPWMAMDVLTAKHTSVCAIRPGGCQVFLRELAT